MWSEILTGAGAFGAALIIGAFFSTQQKWLDATGRLYLGVNLLGALLILASLAAAWNLPSAIIEGFWAAISLYGLVRSASSKTN
jgi:hypothetical protein